MEGGAEDNGQDGSGHLDVPADEGDTTLPLLPSFESASVPVTRTALAGYTASVAGDHPALRRIDGFEPGSPYGLVELTLYPGVSTLVDAQLRYVRARWPDLDLSLLLSGDLRMDVFRIQSATIDVADLRTGGALWRANATPERLRQTEAQADASPEWELVRMLVNERQVAAIEVPSHSGPGGRDLMVRRRALTEFEFERIGPLHEVAPALQDRAALAALESAFARVLRRKESTDPTT